MTDLGLALAALLGGWAGAPLAAAGALFLVAVAIWGWTRRRALARLALRERLLQSAVALAMLAVVLGIFYFLGLSLGGHT